MKCIIIFRVETEKEPEKKHPIDKKKKNNEKNTRRNWSVGCHVFCRPRKEEWKITLPMKNAFEN